MKLFSICPGILSYASQAERDDSSISQKRDFIVTMSMRYKRLLWIGAISGMSLLLTAIAVYVWWFHPPHDRIRDITYGSRGQQNLLLDVFQPPEQNGAAIAVMVSGSWKSGRDKLPTFLIAPFLHRGYTVFAVYHQSQPRCLIGNIVEDIHRAIRFIRHQAPTYKVDPNRLGIIGASSGGHLALMLATGGQQGSADAVDEVDRESSAVQCAACFFPVTDLLNMGDSTENPGDGGPPKSFKTGFGPRAQSLEEWKQLGKELSPIYHLTENLPPVLIIHGDADTLVPLDQSTRFVECAKTAGGEAQLEVRSGKGHGWPTMVLDLLRMADWFDEHLLPANSN